VAPKVRFQGSSSYNDEYKSYKLSNPEEKFGKLQNTCIVERLNVPTINYINDYNHIYYEEVNNRFV
jgi:hypothetical protein